MLLGQPTGKLHSQLRWTILCLPLAMLLTWLIACLTGNGLLDCFGNVIGGDFAMFYIAARMATAGQWLGLYDEPLQQQYLIALIPNLGQNAYLPYRYPPMVAIALQPLAQLPYLESFLLFTLVSMILWLLSHKALLQHYLPTKSASAVSAALGVMCAPVILQTFIDGQASAYWFTIATACWLLTQQRRFISAGCVLALAACKPNVLLLWGLVLVIRYPRMLLGLIPSVLIMISLTCWLVGTDCLAAYANLGSQLAWQPWPVETPYWKVQSLLAWLEPVAGPYARGLNAALGLTSAVAMGLCWRRNSSVTRTPHQAATAVPSPGTSPSDQSAAIDTVALCGALLINALCNPYTPVYDLSLLCLGIVACLPYFALLVDSPNPGCVKQTESYPSGFKLSTGSRLFSMSPVGRAAVISLAVVLLAPVLSQSLAKATGCHLQLAPLLLLLVSLWWLGQWQSLSRRSGGESTHPENRSSVDSRLLAE